MSLGELTYDELCALDTALREQIEAVKAEKLLVSAEIQRRDGLRGVEPAQRKIVADGIESEETVGNLGN